MKSPPVAKPSIRPAGPRHARAGTSTLDALVAFTLLITTISVATPLVVRHGRLLKSQRDYRLALDELSNQLDRLTALPPGELPKALEEIKPSTFMAERVPGARLTGELQSAEIGKRVVLTVAWNEARVPRPSVSLAAWVIPPARLGGGEGSQP